MDATNDPSRILEQARKHLEALKQAGLSREALIALLEEDDQRARQQQLQDQLQQQQQQQQQQQPRPSQSQSQSLSPPLPPPPPQQPNCPPPPPPPPHKHESQLSPSFAVPNHFNPSHQVRSSISSVASNSSGRESILSTATAHSSVSSIGASFAKPPTPAASSEAKYWCTSCDKTFKRKFDWKRHEEEFHERWRKYPCPNCNQSFWGPNTFNQHHKSAHGCKTCPHSDGVVKYMRKRRAWGCGFCAAMHTKLEKHYEHVAAHFEAGAGKHDWMHSNVIYGLLHQAAVLEAWKELISRKQGKFNGHQPMFSWGLDNTGRQQGYVENESQGQLQDFLEFFDGSTEQAQRIAQCAWGYCHVVLKPKPTTEAVPAQDSYQTPPPDHCSLSRQVTITSQSRGLRRTASTSLMPISRQPSRRAASADYREHMQGVQQYTSPVEQSNPYQQNFMAPPPQPVPSQQITPPAMQVETMQMNQRHLSLDKELPPAPLLPSPMDPSPMDVDFHMFDSSNENLLKAPEMQVQDWRSFSSAHSFSDTQSFSSTLIEEQAMAAHAHQMAAQTQGYPMSWEELGHYGGSQQSNQA